MTPAAITSGPSAYWYLTRGTGTVALVLLTVSVVLGVAHVNRAQSERVPRFVLDAVHRTASLLAVVFTALHILTAVADSFAPISVGDAFIPFGGAYRPLWLGLGAVAFDLLLAVALTSILRARLSHPVWRATHWAAYLSWPVAVLHGLGTGSDTRFGWMIAIVGLCVVAVAVAATIRLVTGRSTAARVRVPALGAAIVLPFGLIVWLPSGPLAAGWARRSGTPAYLLSSATAPSAATTRSAERAASSLPASFALAVSGSAHDTMTPRGQTVVDLVLRPHGYGGASIRIRIVGRPLAGGGVQMTSSSVRLNDGPGAATYSGVVTALDGSRISAGLRAPDGARLELVARLRLNPDTGVVEGTVRAGAGAVR